MGVHVRDDSIYSQNGEKMADIDGYSQSQRDFYTIKPHLYAQQPVKSSQGPQQFHLNSNDAAQDLAANGSVTPTNLARPSKAEVIFNMTPHEIRLTQALWSELMNDPETLEKSAAYGTPTALFCEQFYTNLMAAHAEISSIFPSIKKQSVAVAGVFGLAIKSLNNIESLDEFLWSVGKRHNRMIGVEPIHYRWLGEAMVKTFADRFGDRFTLEVETAWIKIYSYLANKLLAADEEPNVLMFAPQKRYQQPQQQQQPQPVLSSSPTTAGISPTSSYAPGGYQTTQDVRKPSISSSLNTQSLNTSISNSTAPTSVVNSVITSSVPATPTANNAANISARRNVSAAPSIPASLPSAPAPAPAATDFSAAKNSRIKGRKHGRKGKEDEKCVIA
ncbi:putative globin-like protein [Yarrowia sp. C11]|nr:putative globin-like protein [Yarrowia sp. E02]KAG5367369.1 putative globin-like protein [Yarrowia sp. C11]